MAEFDGHIRQVGHITNQLLDEFREKVSQISESSWRASNAKKPNQFDVFKDSVHHLVLQFPMNLEDHRVSGFTRHWRDWRDSMSTVLEAVSGYYQFPRPKTSRIMLARLFPGADIPLHIDGSEAARKPHKIHLPILTSEKVEFLFEDAEYHLEAGRMYEVNNRVPHGGRNASDTDRVHLIFDYYDENGTP